MNGNASGVFVTLSLSVLSLVCGFGRGTVDSPPGASLDEVRKLINQLGDADFAVREHATETLKSRPRAIPALRAAVHSDDAEIRRRCEIILEALRGKQLTLALEKMREAKRDGKIDLFVEYATIVRVDLTNETCPLYDLVQEIVSETKRRPFAITDSILSNLSWMKHAQYISPEHCSADTAGEHKIVAFTNTASFDDVLSNRAIVSRNGVRARDSLGYSLILSNGNVVVRGDHTLIEPCIIVCDGDVEADTIFRSIVIARGRVKHKKCDDSLIIDGERAALGKLSFFELSDVGLEVAEEDSCLRIKSVKKKCPCGRCGFQANDCLLAVNGKKVESTNDFRRLVRHHLAESVMEPKPLPVQVQRAGKKIDLALELD